jgi:sugar phosphate permease
MSVSPQLQSGQRWRRIIPVALAMYTIAYIDRTNVSLAMPSMSGDLHMRPDQAGNAAGIFFWGYFFLQIPGGYLAERWSAKKVISILLVCWGACATAAGLVTTVREFWVLRFLLGVAEGGVFPATIILLSHWFPPAERARANAYWMLCQPAAIVISSPLSGWILGRWNWRVLLIAEGALPFLWLAIWVFTIDDRPATAPWLAPDEREYLMGEVARSQHAPSDEPQERPGKRLIDLPTIILVVLYFFLTSGSYGYLFWLPSALKAVRQVSDFRLGTLFAIPYLLAGTSMVLISRHSDATRERYLHVTVPILLSAVVLLASVLTSQSSPLVSFALVCLVGAGSYGCLGPLWAIPTEKLRTRSPGVATGLVNAVGNLGGYFGPLLVGVLRTRTGDFRVAFAALSACTATAGILAFLLRLALERQEAKTDAQPIGRARA